MSSSEAVALQGTADSPQDLLLASPPLLLDLKLDSHPSKPYMSEIQAQSNSMCFYTAHELHDFSVYKDINLGSMCENKSKQTNK